MSQLKVTLTRGTAGKTERQLQTLAGLGLRKPHQSVVLDDNASIRGMIDKVAHLVAVQEIEE